MWPQISSPEAFAQACGLIEAVLAALMWRHRPMRRGWGLGWFGLTLGAAAVVNLAAPWLVTPLLAKMSVVPRSPVLAGFVMLLGFASLAAMVAGLRAFCQRPGWKPTTVFLSLWLTLPVLVFIAAPAGFPSIGDWVAMLLFSYGAVLCWHAGQRERGVGHWLLAGVLVLHPAMILAMGFTSLDIATIRYLAAGPYTVIGVVLFSVTLNRLRLERERAQEELRELNADLEMRVVERTHEIEQRKMESDNANQKLQSALHDLHQAKDRLVQSEKMAALGGLVAGVAHELNTPLGNALTTASTLVDGFRELAQSQSEGTLRNSQLKAFLGNGAVASDLIVRNVERAAGLVQTFKLVAVEQATLQHRVFDLRQVVSDTLAVLKPSFADKPVVIVQDIPSGLSMNSHPGQLEQVLTNLVQNSVVHGLGERPALQVSIIARPLSRDGQAGVEIVCTDNGEGMTEQVVKQAFDPYFTTRFGQGGSGLGLYIVYNLVQNPLGGTITLVSASGDGARFTLWLPLRAPGESADELSR